jgi:hypothetical protein
MGLKMECPPQKTRDQESVVRGQLINWAKPFFLSHLHIAVKECHFGELLAGGNGPVNAAIRDAITGFSIRLIL